MNYEKIYNSLIQKRLTNKIDRSICYCEYHHIKMRSLYPALEHDPNNIVALTAREHFIAHRLLAKWYQHEYGNNNRYYNAAVAAVWKFVICKGIKITARTYEKLKLEFSKTHSADMSGCNNPMYGKNVEDFMSKEAIVLKRTKQRANAKGGENARKIANDPVKGKQWRDKIRKAHIGMKLSKQHKKNIGKASVGKHWWNNGIKEVFDFECPDGYLKGRLPMSSECKGKIAKTCKKSVKEAHDKIRKEQPKKFKAWHLKAKNAFLNQHYHWYNNGQQNILASNQPEGFVPGRIKQK